MNYLLYTSHENYFQVCKTLFITNILGHNLKFYPQSGGKPAASTRNSTKLRHICFDFSHCSETCARRKIMRNSRGDHHGEDFRFGKKCLFCGSVWGVLLRARLKKYIHNNS